MSRKSMVISVPGSTANLGAGFDSLGLAVGRYLQIEAVKSDSWRFDIHSDFLDGVPTDENNLICQTAAYVAKDAGKPLPPCRVRVQSELPLARGLGSSAAAIVAGIELANVLLDLKLSPEDKLRFACAYENHCDNVAASVFGGLVVTGRKGENIRCLPAGVPDIDLVAIVPPYELKTADTRDVLPKTLSFETAVASSGIANMTVAAILQNNWKLAGELMTEDAFHQPYRARLVSGFKEKVNAAREAGAYGAALSGAGPTLLAFAPKGEGKRIAGQLSEVFNEEDVYTFQPDASGVTSKIKTPSTQTL